MTFEMWRFGQSPQDIRHGALRVDVIVMLAVAPNQTPRIIKREFRLPFARIAFVALQSVGCD